MATKQRGLTRGEQNAFDAATEYDDDVTALLVHVRALRAALTYMESVLRDDNSFGGKRHAWYDYREDALKRAVVVLAAARDGDMP